jgi:uncharacterized lipoprotein YddW (UPF0748 family)
MKMLRIKGFGFIAALLVWVAAGVCAGQAPANVRAVWVRPLMLADRPTRATPERGRAYVRAELERLRGAGFNTVYVETIYNSYTLYPSKLLPLRPAALPGGVANPAGPGWDVLQTYLDEGRKLNLSIHVWAHVFHLWNTGLGPLEKSPVLGAHPDWVALNRGGSPEVVSEAEGPVNKIFGSPSSRGLRDFLVKLFGELAANYPALAGVQLDYIRYPLHWPEAPFDFNPDALRLYKTATKLVPQQDANRWQDWKTQQVTDAVREISTELRRANPKLIISAAVFPGFAENLRVKMQDSQTWARRGYVDALLPMAYSRDFARVENWCKEFRAGIPKSVRVYPALYVGHFYDAHAKTLDMRYLELPAKLKMDGYGLFAAQLVTDDLAAKLSQLK